MVRCTLVSTFSIILGIAQQRVETPDCVNYCPAPVMYLLNTDPPHNRPPYVPLALRKWYAEWTLSVYTSPPSPVSPVRKMFRMKCMTIISLFSQWSIDIFLDFRSCWRSIFLLFYFFLFFVNITKILTREREKKGEKCLSFVFIKHCCTLYCYKL